MSSSNRIAPEHAAQVRNVRCRFIANRECFADTYAASADRRPVDPPPIVELRIFEGENDYDLRDITFSVTANYFLFSTLEPARHIAAGRVGAEQGRATVLTGTPVAGMVYLDRPTAAGYFIFPDLSVRHEGSYRLAFSLYEELKDPKDEDRETDSSKANDGSDSHVTHRLEVKSTPFTVYSAKKFPGLTESTALSRTVAEQGCRVRIRRDVRMRRPNAKGGKDWDGYEDDTADSRARMSATPDPYQSHPSQPTYGDSISRPRSASNHSHQSMAQPVISRRTSFQDMQPAQGYYQPSHGTTPHTPQTAYAQSSPFGPSPAQQYSQPPYMQQAPAMQPPPPQFTQPTYQALPPPQPAAPSQHGYYGYAPAPHVQTPMSHQYGPPPPVSYDGSDHSQRSSADYSQQMPVDHRQSTANKYQPPPLPAPPVSSPQYGMQSQHDYQAPVSQPGYHHAHAQSIGYDDPFARPAPKEPPVRAVSIPALPTARPAFNDRIPSLPSINTALNSFNKPLEPASPASAIAPQGYHSSIHTPVESNKRGFGQVFNENHINQPLRHGARPSDAGFVQNGSIGYGPTTTDVDDDDGEPEFDLRRQMVYRRANGRHIARHVPAQS